MRYISIKDAKPGMHLAYDVYDANGRILIGNTCELTEQYINRLKDFGFIGMYIDDKLSEGIEIEDVISPRLRTEGMACIRNRDIEGCKRVAKSIVAEIMSKKTVSFEMTDLRTYDDYTFAHSVNVAVLCGAMGMGMHMSEQELTQLVTAALLHDLGKLDIPIEILNKPGRLLPEEYQIMKTHSQRSYDLLVDRWDISAHVKVAVLFHHENIDGSGYPRGLEGKDQTLFTKILHVADVYDALVSKRPYKNPYLPGEAMEYLMGGCGILFDLEVVQTLLSYVPIYPKGAEIRLSDGRKGIVFENYGNHNLRPIVRLLDGTMIDLTIKDHLNLTLTAVQDEYLISPEESEAQRREMLKALKRFHIVAVDSQKENLQMLQEILQRHYEVSPFRSVASALKHIEEHPQTDLVLMDLDMPNMKGPEAARQIQELKKGEVPVLFITNRCDSETVLACRKLNAAGYIVRPYQPAYVNSEVQRILNLQRQKQHEAV